ncbi:hypothetical protein BV898_17348 [Hypsibius exemplaris]|uniref:SPOC domain-containing protein n=1 Tax=Hypsibius exemplaris TaxID=2072580 RepID=A0A9X6NHZ1_HYPEX|nr:hypothetical protein BV898_17348 [Hypsibius exemplaris]
MPDELKVLAVHCLKTNPDDRPTAATLLNSAYRASLMQKVFDLRETAVTAMVHDEDKSSGKIIYTFKQCFSNQEMGFRHIPAGYVHQIGAHGVFGMIYTVDAFYSDDGKPVKKHAGNQLFRLLFEDETRFEPEKIFNTLWHGSLALKNDHAFVRMYYLSGNQEYANAALPRSPVLTC